jgi:hypothetical protein
MNAFLSQSPFEFARKFDTQPGEGASSKLVIAGMPGGVGSPFKEKGDGNLKNIGNVLQPARPNPVRTFFRAFALAGI